MKEEEEERGREKETNNNNNPPADVEVLDFTILEEGGRVGLVKGDDEEHSISSTDEHPDQTRYKGANSADLSPAPQQLGGRTSLLGRRCSWQSTEQKRLANLEFDTATRASMKHEFLKPQAYNDAEDKDIGVALDLFTLFDTKALNVKELNLDYVSPELMDSYIAYGKNGDVLVTSTLEVNADPLTVIAYYMDFNAKASVASSRARGNEIMREILERPNPHRQFLLSIRKFPPPFQNREFANCVTWKQIDGTFIISGVPCEHPNILDKRGDILVVRANIKRMFRLTPKARSGTKVEFISNLDFWGYNPINLVVNFALPQVINPIITVQRYFQALVTITIDGDQLPVNNEQIGASTTLNRILPPHSSLIDLPRGDDVDEESPSLMNNLGFHPRIYDDDPEAPANTRLNHPKPGIRGSIRDFGNKMKVTLGEGGNTRTSMVRLAFRTSVLVERASLAGFGIEHDDARVHVEELIPNNESETIEDDSGEEGYDSMLIYNLKTNLEAVLQAVPGLFFIVASLRVIDYYSDLNPQYQHSITCGICLACLSLCFFMMNFNWYYFKRNLITFPTHIFIYCAVSYIIPLGMWMSSIMNSFSWGLAIAALYPVMKTTDSFLKSALDSQVFAFVIHQSTFIYGWIFVVPVLTLEQLDKKKTLSFFTGCALPFVCFVYRKAMITWIYKVCKKMVKNGTLSKEKFWPHFSFLCKVMSIVVKFPTVTLMYANKDKRYAIFAAALNNMTEIAGKVYAIHTLDKTLEDYFVALSKSESKRTVTDIFNMATQEAGVHATIGDLSAANRALYEAKKKELLKTIAVSWQAEFVAEKSCILLGGVTHLFVFISEGEDPDYYATAELTAIFSAFEGVTDAIIAYIVVRFYNMPLNRKQSSSAKQLVFLSVALGFNFEFSCNVYSHDQKGYAD